MASLPAQETHCGMLIHRFLNNVLSQIYVYRGAIQHHGIVTHVPWTRQADGTSATTGVSTQSSGAGVKVVHFDSACDGVETTSLERFLNVSAKRTDAVVRCFVVLCLLGTIPNSLSLYPFLETPSRRTSIDSAQIGRLLGVRWTCISRS